jgi:hypothetical protein
MNLQSHVDFCKVLTYQRAKGHCRCYYHIWQGMKRNIRQICIQTSNFAEIEKNLAVTNVDMHADDMVSVESTIRVGSIVVFERKGENRVVINTLPFNEVLGYARRI